MRPLCELQFRLYTLLIDYINLLNGVCHAIYTTITKPGGIRYLIIGGIRSDKAKINVPLSFGVSHISVIDPIFGDPRRHLITMRYLGEVYTVYTEVYTA